MKNRIRYSQIAATLLWVLFGLGMPADFVLPKVSAADIDIREFGAKCDGSDDALAIQTALDSMPDGSRLTVPCRAGIGRSALRLRRKNDVTVEGVDGGGFGALEGNPENVLFGIEYCNRCSFRNLTIDVQNKGVAAFSINYSTDSSIEANTIMNVAFPAFAAILGLGNRGNVYTWNTVSNTGVQRVNGVITDGVRGIWLGNPKQPQIEWNAVVTNNKLLDIGASAIAINGSGSTITGNFVEGSEGAGVKVAPPVGQGGRTVVKWNTLRNNRFSGVQVETADSAVLIQGNVLESNRIAGVYVSGGAFVEGEITGNRIAGSDEAGIYIYDADRVLIEENEISGGKSGIVFEALKQNAIHDVRLHANTVTGFTRYGLLMLGRGGSMRGVTLTSNEFTNIKLYGLAIEEQNAGAITGPSLVANCFSNMGVGTLFDTRPSGGLSAPAATLNCIKPPQLRFRPLRINAGGGAYVDPRRQVWQADDDIVPGHPWYHEGQEIKNTATPELYRTGRWKEGTMDLNFTVPNRVYTVTLKFAEPYFHNKGQRIFDIYINGELVLPSFDILANASQFEAVDRSFRVTVTDGRIAIRMVSHADDPMINAIEIQ
jgi:parallel beta-helix repeat protein